MGKGAEWQGALAQGGDGVEGGADEQAGVAQFKALACRTGVQKWHKSNTGQLGRA